LALNMRRMLKNNNLVRKLHACETMGAVTVICTDKTGTLTQNKMQVAEMVAWGEQPLLDKAIAMNTTANLDESGDKGIGNPTEIALLLWMNKNGQDYRQLRQEKELEYQLPFSTERKYMASIARIDGNRWLFVKGAPEMVTTFCHLDEDSLQKIRTRLVGFQNQAMRTLAFACRQLEDGEQVDAAHLSEDSGLTFQGMAAISDPIRTDVPDAVKACVDAGIQVKIVTGDTSATATEIARQIGAWTDDTPAEAQITGTDFAALSDEEAYKRVAVLKVMSRARPSDKQRLVNLLQKRGEVVAVTGDGTNDAPALHHAHVGLSLGSGTSVAKEASDMTLIDDSFRSIVNAVMWGRSLYRNIQRFLYFQLIVNVTALLLVLGGAMIGTDLPLTVTQILWVNLIMDTFAALALASLPPSAEVMADKPRRLSDFIITKGMARGIIGIGLCFFAALFAMLVVYKNSESGIGRMEQTIFFTSFVMLQFWNLFNAKAFASSHSSFHAMRHDGGLLVVLLLVLAGQWLIVTFGGDMFRTCPLPASVWMKIVLATSMVLWLGELYRLLKKWVCRG
ncbi:MAG: cation-translocating P-type ATPase, partial [Bacteroidales bacterium]|nr:cation-translocating P-type ATPase [Bacteroidales bacterium]